MSQDEVPMVRLNTGEELPQLGISGVMTALRILLDENPLALFELAQACQSSNYTISEGSHELLEDGEFISSNVEGRLTIPDTVRSIVLASVRVNVDTLTVKLISPYAEG